MNGYFHQCGNQHCVCDAVLIENYYWIALEWMGNNPLINGSRAFKTKEKCLEYIQSQPIIDIISWTMPQVKFEG